MPAEVQASVLFRFTASRDLDAQIEVTQEGLRHKSDLERYSSSPTVGFVAAQALLPAPASVTETFGSHYLRNLASGYRDDWYDYRGGRVLVASGMAADHSMVVAMIYAPSRKPSTQRADQQPNFLNGTGRLVAHG